MSCFQIRNFVITNNLPKFALLPSQVVSCFQIRNFVITNNTEGKQNPYQGGCELLSNS